MESQSHAAANDAGIHIGKKAEKWRLWKHNPVSGEMERAAWHDRGVKVDEWPVAGATKPTPALIRGLWGSGRYRIVFQTSLGRAAGQSKLITFDDPSEPDRGIYPNDPGLAPPPPPPIAPPPVSSRQVIGVGGINLGDMPRTIDVAALDYYRQLARADADIVLERMRMAHAQDMQRAEQNHALQMASLAANTRTQVEIARAAVTPQPAAPSPEVVELLNTVRTALAIRGQQDAEDDDDDEPRTDPNAQMVVGLLAQHLPSVLEALKGQLFKPAPTPPMVSL